MTSLLHDSSSPAAAALLVAVIFGADPSARADTPSNTPPFDQRGQPDRNRPGPWDNERGHDQWQVPEDVINTIKAMEVDLSLWSDE